jgi:fructose 1,6-bisphosphatase
MRKDIATMPHRLSHTLRRVGLVLAALAALNLASGWVPGAPLGPPIAAATHEGNEPTTIDGPWGGGEP